jgi:hypothetical protein
VAVCTGPWNAASQLHSPITRVDDDDDEKENDDEEEAEDAVL